MKLPDYKEFYLRFLLSIFAVYTFILGGSTVIIWVLWCNKYIGIDWGPAVAITIILCATNVLGGAMIHAVITKMYNR